jgi:hypothetical protein
MIRQHGNNAYCPRVLLPGCNNKHKNKKKTKIRTHKQEQQQNKRENIKGKKKLTSQWRVL